MVLCPRNQVHRKAKHVTRICDNITKILKESGINHLFITGGEPTLWEHLFDFNRYCISIDLESTLVTNAYRFSDDKYWKEYTENPNTYVGVSLKASNSEQLVKTTKVKRFSKVTLGILRAMDFFNSGVGIVYNSHIADNLVEMVNYAVSQCNARTVKIDFCTPVFIDSKPSSCCLVPYRKIVDNVVRDYSEINEITNGMISFIMSIPFCIWPKKFIENLKKENKIESVCHLIKREGLVIGSDGSVYMCNELFDFPVGKYPINFNDAKSLIEFLNSPSMGEFYSGLSKYPSERCQECAWYSDCGGGCPLQWSVYDPDQLVVPIQLE